MAENVITNANDVELVLERSGDKVGTPRTMGRIVVDEFSITIDEDDQSVSGVGFRLPAGISYGDIELSWSFTIMGDDLDVFNMVATEDGESHAFSFTARKTDDDGNVQWEFALDTAVRTSEEVSATSGDPMEYALEGIAVSLDRRVEA